MKKKGQVALYIILGLVIILSISLVLFFKSEAFLNLSKSIKQQTLNVPKQFIPIKTTIDNCIKLTAEDSVYYITRNGGYYTVPKNISIKWFLEDIPYYYLAKTEIVPTISNIEKNLKFYFEKNLQDCSSLNSFNKEGFIINETKPIVQVKINNDSVDFNINYDVKIKKDNLTEEFKSFNLNIKSDLKNMQSAAKEFVDAYSKKPGFICLNCIEDISSRNNVTLDTFPQNDPTILGNDIIWVLIDDQKNTFNNKTATLRFILEK